MKPALALGCLAALALLGQGVAALWVPARLVPDVGLLLVVGAAIGLRSAPAGVLFSALLGYATDCLSGALLGQHMLLALAAYGVARSGATRLNLRGPLPLAIFVTVLTVTHAFALWVLAAFVAGPLGFAPMAPSQVLAHGLVTGIAAPFVTELVARLLAWLGDDEGQRPLRLEPRTLAS